MLTDEAGGLADRATLVVPTSLAARQWEALLAAPQIAADAAAWLTPAVFPYRAWLERLWLDGAPGSAVPLSTAQADALWRRVIGESAESAELIGHRGAAEWAADAWQLLCDWRLDARDLHAGPEQHDYRAFLAWSARYSAILAERGWTDVAGLDAALANLPLPDAGDEWVLADLDESPPARRALFESAARRGARIERWSPPSTSGRASRVRLADATDELRTAVGWAGARLAASPGARVAIVVAGLAERYVDVERALADLPADTPTWHGGQKLSAHALLGAALTGIELVTPQATFVTFSRWLRSPFFGAAPEQHALRARLEARLRGDVRSKAPFAAAYRHAGLADWLQRHAPDLATAVAAALAEVGATRRATPTRWAQLWQRALARLGWQPPGGVADPGVRRWQAALDELARLTPILGDVAPETALAELERTLDRPASAPLPLTGIHVFARLEDVGPGYDAAWLTGFTDTHWPPAPRPNPLLPRSLQRAHGMPWSSPADAERRSAQSLTRVRQRTREVVASWPARVYDYETEPSPALAGWPELAATELTGSHVGARRLALARARESVADAAPAVTDPDVRGGSGMLGRQARCPLRAFCQDRLGVRELGQRSQGLTPQQRGNATHRALELLLRDSPTQAELVARGAAVAGCVDGALDELFRGARGVLRVLFDLERERITASLTRLLELELERTPFTVIAVEEEQQIVVGGRRLRVRLDRLDRLADGSVAIIDHKTGKDAGPGPWLRERPRDVQVPLYAAHSSLPVTAAVIARLHGREAGYFGIFPPDTFPGRSAKPPDDRTWNEQLAVWRSQIERLVDEFVAGDTRLLLADLEDAAGAFAPLTRVAEQLALARGSLLPW